MTQTEDRLMGSKELRKKFGNISDMSLWRWLQDEDLGFPQPLYIARRRYWKIAEVEAFIARQAAAGRAA